LGRLKSPRFLFFLIFFSVVSISGGVAATDPIPACQLCFQSTLKELLAHAQTIERNYSSYRWTEFKIRRLYYDELWLARREALDPLDKKKRELGKEDEVRLMRRITRLEKRSDYYVNNIAVQIRFVRNFEAQFLPCSPERGFQECIRKSLEPILLEFEDFKKKWEHILEGQREYRKATSETTGGLKGFYFEDVIETPKAHPDLYWRFQHEKEPNFFLEDSDAVDFFEKVHKILTWKFQGAACCYKMFEKESKEGLHEI